MLGMSCRSLASSRSSTESIPYSAVPGSELQEPDAPPGSWVTLPRRGEYLPARACKRSEEERLEPCSWLHAYKKFFTGGFLNVHKHTETVDDLKKNRREEVVQIGLITALFLTIFVPLLAENPGDFMEKNYGGGETDLEASWFYEIWFGSDSFLSKAGIHLSPEVVQKAVYDIDLISFGIPVWSLGMSTIASLMILLVYGQLKDDEAMSSFLGLMGNPMKLPFLLCLVAVTGGVALWLRVVLTVRSWWAFGTMFIIPFVFCRSLMHFVIVKSVKVLMTVVRTEAFYEPLSLSADQVREEVAMYVMHAGGDATEGGAIHDMCAVVPPGGEMAVELDGLTQVVVKVEFRKQIASRLGITVNEWIQATSQGAND